MIPNFWDAEKIMDVSSKVETSNIYITADFLPSQKPHHKLTGSTCRQFLLVIINTVRTRSLVENFQQIFYSKQINAMLGQMVSERPNVSK